MTDRVLTDQEIAAEWGKCRVPFAPMIGDGDAHGLARFARAVEAATLAKVGRRVPPVYEIWAGDVQAGTLDALTRAGYLPVVTLTHPQRNAVTEREARKRERKAWEEAWDAAAYHLWHSGDFPQPKHDWRDERDRRYPLPTERVPRTVVLSDGVRVRKNAAGEGWDHFHDGVRMLRFLTLGDLFSLAGTVADARLLADLVERPYDEVPDDG